MNVASGEISIDFLQLGLQDKTDGNQNLNTMFSQLQLVQGCRVVAGLAGFKIGRLPVGAYAHRVRASMILSH